MEKFVLKVIQDSIVESPREWDNLGTMVTWHRHYNLGDDHKYDSPRTFVETMCQELHGYTDEGMERMNDATLFERFQEKAIVLPLFLYDHSVQSISTRSFHGRAQHAEWDSMQVGWIYVTLENVRKEYGVKRVTKKTRERAAAVLVAEVETFDQYIRGDVYGFKLEKWTFCGECDECLGEDVEECADFEVEELDSCWGFYGSDPAENGMRDHLPEEHQHLADEFDTDDIEYAS